MGKGDDEMKTKGLQKVKKVILSGGILLTGLLTFGFSEKSFSSWIRRITSEPFLFM